VSSRGVRARPCARRRGESRPWPLVVPHPSGCSASARRRRSGHHRRRPERRRRAERPGAGDDEEITGGHAAPPASSGEHGHVPVAQLLVLVPRRRTAWTRAAVEPDPAVRAPCRKPVAIGCLSGHRWCHRSVRAGRGPRLGTNDARRGWIRSCPHQPGALRRMSSPRPAYRSRHVSTSSAGSPHNVGLPIPVERAPPGDGGPSPGGRDVRLDVVHRAKAAGDHTGPTPCSARMANTSAGVASRGPVVGPAAIAHPAGQQRDAGSTTFLGGVYEDQRESRHAPGRPPRCSEPAGLQRIHQPTRDLRVVDDRQRFGRSPRGIGLILGPR